MVFFHALAAASLGPAIEFFAECFVVCGVWHFLVGQASACLGFGASKNKVKSDRLNRLRKKSSWQKVRKINRTQLPQDARSFSGDDFASPQLLPIPPKRDFSRSL